MTLTLHTVVKFTKIECRTRYDIPGYESGGLPYGYVSANGNGYLVSTPTGKVLGCVEKWDNGSWTSSKLSTAVTLPEPGEWAFSAVLLGGVTRREAVEKLVWATYATRPSY